MPPALIFTEPVGFANVVNSNVPPLTNRFSPFPNVPSSCRLNVFATPAGRLKMMSVAVPSLLIGSKPV